MIRRRLFTLTATASLLLFSITIVLWVISQSGLWTVQQWSSHVNDSPSIFWCAWAEDGRLGVAKGGTHPSFDPDVGGVAGDFRGDGGVVGSQLQ